jgi:nitroreductase
VRRRELEAILAAADSAPSAAGLKSCEQLIVTDDKTKKRLVEAAHGQQFGRPGAGGNRVLGGAVALREQVWHKRTRPLCGAGCDHRGKFPWLQAVASGLAACWVGAFDDEAVKSIFREKTGPDWRPITQLPVGYAAE